MSLIALLTDFGLNDGYVGIMKGVIANIAPQAQLIDISHQIPPQSVLSGRFCLMNAYPYFPCGTIYLCVIDPGVGSQRRGIAVKLQKGYYVGPDNGLISGILSLDQAIIAVNLTNSQYWRVSNPSYTFHGRDIFASVAAYLAKGVDLKELGEEIPLKSLQTSLIPEIKQTETEIQGFIQYIDHFGNVITNINADHLLKPSWQLQIQQKMIPQGMTYASVKQGELVALVGSHGWLEIAVSGGSAKEKLGVKIGDQIVVSWLS